MPMSALAPEDMHLTVAGLEGDDVAAELGVAGEGLDDATRKRDLGQIEAPRA
jgi:hypothetical protein